MTVFSKDEIEVLTEEVNVSVRAADFPSNV